LNFSEPVFGQSGKFVHIKQSSDNAIFESLYADGTDNPGSITGGGTAQLVIRPSFTPTYANNTSYYVTIEDGAFLDASGNAFAEISSPTALNFTTVALTCEEKILGGIECERGDVGPGGGTVFYTSGTGTKKYMEVAPVSWYSGTTETDFRWCYPQSGLSISGTSAAIGTGKANTAKIAAVCTSNGAAHWITVKNETSGVGGKTDWFLPSKDELNQLCRYARQQSESTAVCSSDGILRAGFQGWSYWSSTQYSSTAAWYQRMNDGVQDGAGGTKTISVWTRPVREFGPVVLQES
jgi:hypothetical protein